MTLSATQEVKKQNALNELNLPKNATAKQIKDRYKKLASTYHPDKSSGDTAKFQAIYEAHQLLLNFLQSTTNAWSERENIYLFNLLDFCAAAKERIEDPRFLPYEVSRNQPIVQNLIKYSESILESERHKVPTVIAQYGKYNKATQQYILDNAYTLNAQNYTVYELLWLHAMLCNCDIILKGTLVFANSKIDSEEQYLLVHLIHSHLKFYHKAAAYAKEGKSTLTPGTFTWYFIQYKFPILLALQILLYAIVFTALALSLSMLPAIASIAIARFTIDEATSYLMSFILKTVLIPNVYYFNDIRTLQWCSNTDEFTNEKMQQAFEEKLQCNKADLTPRHESISEKGSKIWSRFFTTQPKEEIEVNNDYDLKLITNGISY